MSRKVTSLCRSGAQLGGCSKQPMVTALLCPPLLVGRDAEAHQSSPHQRWPLHMAYRWDCAVLVAPVLSSPTPVAWC